MKSVCTWILNKIWYIFLIFKQKLPLFAKAVAISFPIPPLPPVMMTVLLVSLFPPIHLGPRIHCLKYQSRNHVLYIYRQKNSIVVHQYKINSNLYTFYWNLKWSWLNVQYWCMHNYHNNSKIKLQEYSK